MSTQTLTPRERDILELTAAGLTQAEIAVDLGLTASTIQQRAAAMRRRLGAKSMAHAVAIAYQRGLLGGVA